MAPRFREGDKKRAKMTGKRAKTTGKRARVTGKRAKTTGKKRAGMTSHLLLSRTPLWPFHAHSLPFRTSSSPSSTSLLPSHAPHFGHPCSLEMGVGSRGRHL